MIDIETIIQSLTAEEIGVGILAACGLIVGLLCYGIFLLSKDKQKLICLCAAVLLQGRASAGDGVVFEASSLPSAEVTADNYSSFIWIDPSSDTNGAALLLQDGSDHVSFVYVQNGNVDIYDSPEGSNNHVSREPYPAGSTRLLLSVSVTPQSISWYTNGQPAHTITRDSQSGGIRYGWSNWTGIAMAWGFDDRSWTSAEMSALWGGDVPADCSAVFHAGYQTADLNLVDDSDWSLSLLSAEADEVNVRPFGEYLDGVFGLPDPNDPDGGGLPDDPDEPDLNGPTFERPTIGVQPDGSCITGYVVFSLPGEGAYPSVTSASSVVSEIGGDGCGYEVGDGGPPVVGQAIANYWHDNPVASFYNPNAGTNCYIGDGQYGPTVFGGPGEYPCDVVAYGGWDVALATCSGDSCECFALANGTPGDSDGDGIPNGSDTDDANGCGIAPTPCNDSDGNGVLDDFERPDDYDGDGIDNAIDASPRGGDCGEVPLCGSDADADGDGIRNGDDPDGDMDGDGIADSIDSSPEGDGCGSVNDCGPDGDADGDGITNANDPDGDQDGDGIADSEDASPQGSICSGDIPVCGADGDYNGDGIINSADTSGDVDQDGIPDGEDPTPYGCGGSGVGLGCPPCPPCDVNGDADGDGTPNSRDDDADGDGVPNESDSCPLGCDCCEESERQYDCVCGDCDDRLVCLLQAGTVEINEDFDCLNRAQEPLDPDWSDEWLADADCDWDGDECSNKDDDRPCDPAEGCEKCTFVMNHRVQRLQAALHCWITGQECFVARECGFFADMDGDGTINILDRNIDGDSHRNDTDPVAWGICQEYIVGFREGFFGELPERNPVSLYLPDVGGADPTVWKPILLDRRHTAEENNAWGLIHTLFVALVRLWLGWRALQIIGAF